MSDGEVDAGESHEELDLLILMGEGGDQCDLGF